MMPDFGLYHKYAQRKSDGSYRQLIGNATSQNSYTKHLGSYIGYSQVEVTYEDNLGKNNGKTVSKFFNHEDFFGTNNLALEYYGTYFKFTPLSLPHNGTLYKQEKYKRLKNGTTYILVHELYNEYKMNSVLLNFDINKSFKLLFKNSDYVMSGLLEKEWSGYTQEEKCLATLFNFYPYYSPLIQQSSQKETLYDLNGENPIITTQNFYYDNNVEHFQKTRIEIADSRGNTLETKIYYPDDISGTNSMAEGGNLSAVNYTEIQKLKKANKHQINTPIQTVFKKNGIVTKVQRNLFDLFDELVLPSIIQTAKDNTTLEDKIIYHDYYLNGNPKEVSKADGTPIVYIWGYSEQYPIAKIENASFTTITSAQQTLIDNAIVASENDTNTNTENTLRTALQSLRDDFSTSMVTTYTYDPLIGVTSITDPKGYTIYYEYDAFNRLKQVKDADGNILSENEYHYKSQN